MTEHRVIFTHWIFGRHSPVFSLLLLGPNCVLRGLIFLLSVIFLPFCHKQLTCTLIAEVVSFFLYFSTHVICENVINPSLVGNTYLSQGREHYAQGRTKG